MGGLLAGYSVTGRDGRLMGTGHAVARALLSSVVAPMWAIGLLLGVVDPARRALLDRVTGSRAPYRVAGTPAATGQRTKEPPGPLVESSRPVDGPVAVPPAPRVPPESTTALTGS